MDERAIKIKSLQQIWANLPFLVRFGLNLGLNNLKFCQEAIFAVDWVYSIESIKLNRFDPIDIKNWVKIGPKMDERAIQFYKVD